MKSFEESSKILAKYTLQNYIN